MPVLGQHWANTLRQYWPNAEPLLPKHWANTACWYWASTGPIHCASTGPMLNHYYPSTGLIQHAGTGPVLDQYIAPALAQCWTSIGPTLGQYHMPALARFTAAVQSVRIGPMPFIPACQYWPNTVMFAGNVPADRTHMLASYFTLFRPDTARLLRPIVPVDTPRRGALRHTPIALHE